MYYKLDIWSSDSYDCVAGIQHSIIKRVYSNI